MKVLLVDDESEFLEQTGIFLEENEEGFDLTTALSGEEALKELEKEDYDAIVSDYRMPEMDGLELLRRVRDRGIKIPFIIFTGKGREEVAIEAFNLGANRYIRKGGDLQSQYDVLRDSIKQEVKHHRTEKKLKKSEEEKSLILDSTNELIAYHDTGHHIKWANKAYQEATGLPSEELEGKICYHSWGLDEECSNCPVTRAIRNGESAEAELTPEAQENWPPDQGSWLVRASPVEDENERVIGAVEIASDITEKKEAERRIKQLNSLLKSISRVNQVIVQEDSLENVMMEACSSLSVEANFLGSAIALLDEKDGMISPFTTGRDCSLSEDWSVTPEGEGEAPDCIKETVRSKEMQVLDPERCQECPYKTSEVGYTCILVPMVREETVVGLLYVGMENPVELTSEYRELLKEVSEDLAYAREKIKSEEALRESEEKFRRLADTSPFSIFVYKERFLFVNPASEKLTGYSEDELLNMEFWELVHEDHRETVKRRGLKRVKKTGEELPTHYEFKIQRKDGDVRWVYFTGADIKYEGKRVGLGTALDITERKKAEEKVNQLNRTLRAIRDVNQLITRVKDREELLGKTCEKLNQNENYKGVWIDLVDSPKGYYRFTEEVPDHSMDNLKDLINKESMSEWERRPLEKDEVIVIEDQNELSEELSLKGDEIEYSSALVGLDYKGKKYGVLSVLASPSFKLDEVEQELLKEVANDIAFALHNIEVERSLKEREEKYRTLFEVANDAILIMDGYEFMDCNSKTEDMFGCKKEEIIGKTPWDIISPDVQPDGNNSKKKAKRKIDKTYDGVPQRFEWKHCTIDGEEFFTDIILTKFEVQKETYIMAIVRDITERREVEEQEDILHSLLRHDVRNKLQIAMGYMDLMNKEELNPDDRQYLDKTLKTMNDAYDIVEKVRYLRDIERAEVIQELNIGMVLDEVIDDVQALAHDYGVKIKNECKDFHEDVKGTTLLTELFVNLVENSIKHSDGTEVVVSTEEKDDQIICSIEDDGKGLSEEIKERIFERDFKRGENAGSGLGMYLVKEITDKFGGEIKVKDSELGGAKFEVHLRKA